MPKPECSKNPPTLRYGMFTRRGNRAVADTVNRFARRMVRIGRKHKELTDTLVREQVLSAIRRGVFHVKYSSDRLMRVPKLVVVKGLRTADTSTGSLFSDMPAGSDTSLEGCDTNTHE